MEIFSKEKTKKRTSVTCYKATDGKYFEDKKEYLQYQKNLNIKENINNLMSNYSINGEESAKIAEFLYSNKEVLLNILLDKGIDPASDLNQTRGNQ